MICLKKMRKRIKRILAGFIFIVICIYIGLSISIHDKPSMPLLNREDNKLRNYDDYEQVCVHPKLDPFAGEYAKHFHSVDPLKCSAEEDWLSLFNGTIYIDPGIKKTHGAISCSITFFDRIDDFGNKDLKTFYFSDETKLPLLSDYFKANCNATDGSHYKNVHAGIRYVPEYHKKTRTVGSGLGLDVLILGFDSLSHMTYRRKLAKTYKYFTENLKGIVLNGYNIVGDGTPQALIPIFTGKTELELPRTLKRLAKKEFVDVYPMVWKDFRKKGYVTAWAEDCPHIGTFTYRMVGFKDSPTDHYMRPFYVTAEHEYYKKQKYLCLGSKKRSQVFMNWIKEVYTMYDDASKFVFGFHSEASHHDNNVVETADEDLYNLLKFLNEGHYLRNTLVILMSDHGARFSSLRSSLQGKQEERLPFFGFSFPEWFRSKYREAFQNFRLNADRLTCPFDLHPTFLDILDFTGAGIGNITKRGISLFKEIPKSRNCVSAGIETHWCACLNWQTLDINNLEVKNCSDFAVSEINKLTEPYRKLCDKLSLKSILRAQQLLPEKNMLGFKKTIDYDGFKADLSDDTAVINVVVQIWIYTKPGDGLFEVTVNHNLKKNTFFLDESSISRVNKYGDAPKCIEKEHEELRKYCYCYK